MVEYRNFPLVLKTDGTNPVGIAESSSIGTLYISSLVVSTVYADTYQNIPGSFNFTGILTVTSTGSGTPIVDNSDPNNPKFKAFSVTTDGFVDITPHPGADPGLVIVYGPNALAPERGGTGYDLPGGEGEIPAWTAGGQLQPRPGFTFNSDILNLPVGGEYHVGGSQIGLGNLGDVNAGSPNPGDVLSWDGGSWSPVAQTGGITLPNNPGRIPYVIDTTSLGTVPWLNIETGTGRVNVCSVCAVGSVCATVFVEGGQSLSVKYLTKTVADTYYQPCDIFLDTLSTNQSVDLENDVVNTLPVGSGGTGLTTFTPTGALLYAGGIDNVSLTPAPQTNKYLKWNGTAYTWDSPTGTGTGTTISNNPGRIPYIIDTTSLGDVPWFNIETGTGRVNVCSVCAVGSVCATTFVEGGQTLVSKYQPVGNYQPCDVFLTTLTTNGSVRLNTTDVTNILPLTKGGLGFTSLDENRILVGGAANSVTTITSPSPGYLKWNGTAFSWDSPTGTVTLPSDACAVVFMNSTGNGLVSNPAIKINNTVSTLEILSNLANASGGIDLAPDVVDEGFVRWDHDYDTLGIVGINDTNIALGVDELIPITNTLGVTIQKGQVVYVSGSSGGSHRGTVALLENSNNTASIIGVCLHQIADTESGYAIKKGLIKSVSLTNVQQTGDSWAEGDILYVASSAGKLTNIHPPAGNRAAKIGIVLTTGGGNATFGVSVDRGYDLSELHDVNATPTNDGDTLVWNTGGYYTTGTINNVRGTLTLAKGGTGSTAFSTDGAVIYYDGVAFPPQLTSNSGFKFSSNVLISPTVCATTVCATTFQEGGTTLPNRYLTQVTAAATYQTKSEFSTFTGTLGELAFDSQVFLDTTSVTGTLTVSRGGTGLTTLTAGSFLVGNGTASVSLSPTGNFQVTSTKLNSIVNNTTPGFTIYDGTTYTFTPTGSFATTGSLKQLAYLDKVDLTTTSVTGTLAILNGGTGKTAFNPDQLIYSNNFAQSSDLTFNGTVLKSPVVCGTTVCATTFEEGGTTLASKYLTQANAAATYQTKSDFSTFTGITLKELAYKDRVDLDTTSVTGTLAVSKGGTGLTTLTAGNFLIGNGTSISLTPTSTFETTGYSRANFATTASLNNYTLTSTFNSFRVNATDNEGIVLNDNSDNLYTTPDLKFVNNTTLKTPQVCATTVCATTFEEGGTILSTKYQGKNTTLDSISNLTFNNNNYFYKNNTGTFVTGTVTPCAVQLLDDATYSDMRTTLELGSLAIKSTISNSDIDNATIQFSKLANGAYIPTGTYTSIGLGLASSLTTPATNSVVIGNTAGNAVLLGQNSVGNSYTLKHQEGIIKWYKDIELPAEVASPPEFTAPSSTYYSSLIVDDLSSVNHYNENSYIFYAEVDTLSATTYLNLPSGVATWNANKINGYSITGSAPVLGNLLIYQYPNTGQAVWQYYGAEDLGELAIFNAEKIQGVGVVTSVPTTNNQAFVYESSSSKWKPGYTITYSTSAPTGGADGDIHIKYFTSGTDPAEIGIACSDETTNLTSGTAKATFRMPYAMYLSEVRANVNTAPSGSTIIVDVNKNGSTIFSTRVTIDSAEKTSKTAATAAVITTNSLADDDEITIDIDQIGSTTAGKGLKVWLIGYRL